MSKPISHTKKTGLVVFGWDMAASGLAAAWVTENTGEAIWRAMERR